MVLINHCAQVYNSFLLPSDFKHVYLTRPDYIVLQVGIVDCSPRKPDANAPFPFMKGKSPWVSINEFYNNLDAFLTLTLNKANSLSAILLVNIVCASEAHFRRHPGARENAVAYNGAIAQLVTKHRQSRAEEARIYLVDLHTISAKTGYHALCTDGVHINALGSGLLADEIVRVVKEDKRAFPDSSRIYKENIFNLNDDLVNRILGYIDEIRKHIMDCRDEQIPLLTRDLVNILMKEIDFDSGDNAMLQDFKSIIQNILDILRSGSYYELSNVLECQLKTFLNIDKC